MKLTDLYKKIFLQITDGEKGMNEIQQWLINIQARAPNSPVIIVGTHMDVVKGQLVSKCPFGVIVSTKIPTKKFDNFCPRI